VAVMIRQALLAIPEAIACGAFIAAIIMWSV
jgi:hypothetical protein